MGIRFLHTADWQLGREFLSLGPEAGPLLRAQRLKTVRRLAELAQERGLDAILVAGDVFEHQEVSQETIAGALGALQKFAGAWVLLPGNHDCAEEGSVWDRLRHLAPRGNIRLATAAEPILLGEGRLAILPAPLTRRHEASDLTAAWDGWTTPQGACRVGLAHGSVEGILWEAAEATNPISAQRAQRARLDYLALGDWHGTREINPRTWYSGTPEPDRFVRNQSGGALLVEIAAPGAVPQVERLATGHYDWTGLEAELNLRTDVEKLDRDLGALTDWERQIVRLELSGALTLPELGFLEERLTWWRGQTACLEVRRERLRPRTELADFEAVQTPGFVRAAVEALRQLQQAGSAAETEAAADALELLYQRCAAQEVSA